MRFTHSFLGLSLATALAAQADEGIRTYFVPKEKPVLLAAAPGDAASPMPAADIPVNASPVTWKTPETWQELQPTSIRIGNFLVKGQDGAKAETAIYSFPGAVGTELDNVNRWRNELHLPPLDAAQIKADSVTVDGLPGKLYEINGASNSTVVASLPRNGAMWFIKMRGDKDVVADAEPVFRDFLKTIHFADSSPASNPSHPSNESAADNSSTDPKWEIPSDWKEKSPGPMVFKSYSVSGEKGQPATVSVSVFPEKVGTTAANVNRWRAQMTLPPLDDDKVNAVTQNLSTAAGKAIMVDFTGTDSRTTQPGRLVAISILHGDSNWFFKLMGNESTVQAQKEKFVKFVQSVQLP